MYIFRVRSARLICLLSSVKVAFYLLQKRLNKPEIKIVNGSLVIYPVIERDTGGKFIKPVQILIPGDNTPRAIPDTKADVGLSAFALCAGR